MAHVDGWRYQTTQVAYPHEDESYGVSNQNRKLERSTDSLED